jgi:uncharacterized protein with ParB-like and HNH nuclease domain
MGGNGIMFTFSPRDYNIRELYEWYRRKELVLSPKFQRRSVWEYKAKSYLIDSILRGWPIPRIYIREKTNLDFTAKKEIVDGQQRLRAIFDFLEDGFRISKVHNIDYPDMLYSDLPDVIKADFLKYTISSLLLVDLPDSEILNMFARLNTYSVRLNPQELLNSQYFGYYKQLVYSLSNDYRTFWLDNKILTEKAISRMDDAKFISDILLAIVSGEVLSNSMAINERFYRKYDDEFGEYKFIEKNLKLSFDLLNRLYGDSLSETSYKQLPLLYSTILILYHMHSPVKFLCNYNIKYEESHNPRLKTALDEIDALISSDNVENPEIVAFILTLKKNTTTPNVRLKRCEYIASIIFKYLK